MKPLLTVPLTEEDWQIHTRDVGRGGFKASFYSGRRFSLYCEADRLDAALMCEAQYWRRGRAATMHFQCGTTWLNDIAVGGADQT